MRKGLVAVVCLSEWTSTETEAPGWAERREALLDLYLQSLLADERLGCRAGRHSVSAGVLRLVLQALSEEQLSG